MVIFAAAAAVGFGLLAGPDANLTGVVYEGEVGAYEADDIRHRVTLRITRDHALHTDAGIPAQSIAVNCGFTPTLPKLRYLLDPITLEVVHQRKQDLISEVAEAIGSDSVQAAPAINEGFTKMIRATFAATAKEVSTVLPQTGPAANGAPRELDYGHQKHNLSLNVELNHATQPLGDANAQWTEEKANFSMEWGSMNVPVPTPIAEREYLCPGMPREPLGLIAGGDEYGYSTPTLTISGKVDYEFSFGLGQPKYSGRSDTDFGTRVTELPSVQRQISDFIKTTDLGIPAERESDFQQGLTNFVSWEMSFEGADMNRLGTVGGDHSSLSEFVSGIDLQLPPGTIFQPDDKDYQWMMSVGQLGVRYSFEEDMLAALYPERQEPTMVRTMCLEMEKLEPRSGIKYMPYANPDPILRKLAGMTAQSLSRGPWDQARIWTYTDNASLTEINKKFLEPLIPGYYVRNLRDLQQVGAVVSEPEKRKKLFSTELLFSPAGDPQATLFVCSTICRESPKEAAAALNKPDEYGMQLFTETGANLKVQHIEMMLFAALTSEHLEVRKGALTFLGVIVPESARGWVSGLSVLKFIPGMKAEDEVEGKMINTVRAMYAL